ncbi:MAG: PqqD family peptide modification chaperone, partial [Rhodospirillaceae bacterium]|nr:PqqD family peptide modification chaperone [Rhodospirillaceae bacterium]
WPFEPDEGDGALDIAIEAADGGYLRRTAWGEDIRLDHARDAANALAGALVEGFVRQDEALVCLHAAAVRLGPALVLFVGDSEAGKSSLSLHLAAAGHRFFGDDRIVLDLSAEPVAGLCLGLAPDLSRQPRGRRRAGRSGRGIGAMRYRRNPAVSITEAEDETFLVLPGTEEVFYLDPVASGLWRLLAEPVSREEIVETFGAAFPDRPAAELAGDLDRALAELLARSLALSVP